MTDSPLCVSFLWHMHQPFYKDPSTGLYRLPWVRLHGTKDYLDMLEILRDFPDIRQTFNFTPSLLEQVTDYAEHDASDRYLELTLKKACDLNHEDKLFLLENFFLANWDNMIRQFPRYFDLLTRRGFHIIRSELDSSTRYFNEEDFLDLQVLFNLCWVDPMFRNTDPFLTALVQKGRDFTEDEKNMLVSKQLSLLKKIVPSYREMANTGQIELSASPFYHPILPLLCDTGTARIAMPDVRLPRKRFSHPEDAEKQIRMGIDYFERIFGQKPTGMWPSEGSVSEEVVQIASRAGIQWLGTDEDILATTLGKQLRDPSRYVIAPGVLYRPYMFKDVSIIFRDHEISDLIGFIYSKWDAKDAARDLISRLLHVHNSLSTSKPPLLAIILDGENAWEYYKNDGHDFLRYLYEGLSREERLKTITVSEYLKNYGRGEPLQKLHSGSWIYANFAVWIGHEEDNTAWDYLTEARGELEVFQKAHPERDLSEAWKALYIAEGSDWNWWYGDEHTTETQKDFDDLFRMNLMKVYGEIGKEVPPHLFIPVLKEDRSVSPTVAVRGFIDPRIDGIVTSYYEWYQGARLDIGKSGGSMHKSESILSSLYYGFNKDFLFLRLDPSAPFAQLPEDSQLSINVDRPAPHKILVTIKHPVAAELLRRGENEWIRIKDIPDIAVQDILEIRIAFSDLQAMEKDEIILSVSIIRDGEEIERCPWRGHVAFSVPTADFEAMMWY